MAPHNLTPREPEPASSEALPLGDPGEASVGEHGPPLHPTYPMRVVTRMTGLNPDTIRAWERRYGAIAPRRTHGKTRLFSAEDVRRLGLLRDVVALGHPVSRVAPLETHALERLLRDDEPRGPNLDDPGGSSLQRLVDEYLTLVKRFEVRRAYEHLVRIAALLPPREFLLRMVVPMVHELVGRVARDEMHPAQAHLVHVQLRNCLLSFPLLRAADRGAPRVLVGTPPGPRHMLGGLVASLFLAMYGFDAIDLGGELDPFHLLWAVEQTNAAVLILATLGPVDDPGQERLRYFVPQIPARTEAWLVAGATQAAAIPRLRRITSFEALEVALVDASSRA